MPSLILLLPNFNHVLSYFPPEHTTAQLNLFKSVNFSGFKTRSYPIVASKYNFLRLTTVVVFFTRTSFSLLASWIVMCLGGLLCLFLMASMAFLLLFSLSFSQ